MFKVNFPSAIKAKSSVDQNLSRLLLSGVCFPLLGFNLLAIAVSQQPNGLPWDAPIMLTIHSMANPQLDVFAALFTQLGIYWGVTPILIILAGVLLFLQRWRSLVYLLSTTSGAVMINHATKVFFHRPRPHLWELFYPLPSDYSFPSGHALSSMTLVVILVTLTWGSRWCKWVMLGGSLFVLGIGWTRLYLGVHYPSDILGGWLLAIAWGIAISLPVKPQLAQKLK